MEYYSVMKRDKQLIYAITWMTLVYLLCSERSQNRKATYSIIPLHDILEQVKL